MNQRISGDRGDSVFFHSLQFRDVFWGKGRAYQNRNMFLRKNLAGRFCGYVRTNPVKILKNIINGWKQQFLSGNWPLIVFVAKGEESVEYFGEPALVPLTRQDSGVEVKYISCQLVINISQFFLIPGAM